MALLGVRGKVLGVAVLGREVCKGQSDKERVICVSQLSKKVESTSGYV